MTDEPRRILVVDDDSIVADSIAAFLTREGYEAGPVHSGTEALETLGRGRAPSPWAVVIVDMAMPEMSGLELIQEIRRSHPDVVSLAITGYGTIESAVEAMRAGASDYLIKPVVDEELLISIERAIRQHVLIAENSTLKAQLHGLYGLENIIGDDDRMRRIYDVIEAVAPSKTTILMTGESGTGKSLIARAIHRNSARRDKPFVELSCGSIPETLLESELFGHVKGAYTGAHVDKMGRFLAAHGGTIFLDEINSASPGMQLKLLRVLQERKFEPVGSTETVEVDVRVILASNQPLDELVARGEFRHDLYYRINVVMIHLPPLRERLGDIPLLAEHFLHKHAAEAGREIISIDDDAMNALRAYAFPGNVRELENIIERAVVLTRSPRVRLADLPAHVVENSTGHLLPDGSPGSSDGIAIGPWTPMPLAEALKDPEKQIILNALEANDWNRQKTADDLHINRTTLYKKIKQYGLERYGRAG